MKLIISDNLKKILEENNKTKQENEVIFSTNLNEDVTQYVNAHTSGIKEHYPLEEGGNVIVTFDRFKKMVEEGYNIIESKVLNKQFISIVYQREITRENRRK